MRLVQAFRKLATNTLWGYDLTSATYVDTENPALLESTQRWISERVGFNARRVLLCEKKITQRAVKVGDDTLEHILYSEQKNIRADQTFLYDYTILDKTHQAQTVSFTATQSASGLAGDTTEDLSAPYPVHMIRYAGTNSKEAESQLYSRLYAFAPGNIQVDTDQELLIAGERYIVEEAFTELLTTRLMVTRR